MFKHLFFLFASLFLSEAFAQKSVYYTVNMPQPQTHYLDVEARFENVAAKTLEVKMPVWAPGSYLVREFARNMEDIKVTDEAGTVLPVVKSNKNTWTVTTNGKKNIVFNYKVYANELSVRTSFINAEHAFISGTSVFVYAKGAINVPCKVKINPYKDWKKVSTSLTPAEKPFEYSAPDYDVLVDSPFEIGNHVTFDFMASGCNHSVAMFGDGNYNVEELKKDMAKVIEACTSVVGENPNKGYTFIVHNLTNPSGGLEHLSSTTLEVNRFTYQPRSSYLGFLALVAHEYFHLWNVKRIRPIALGPFDYDNENYTELLWVSEGFTSYYEEHLLLKAGFKTPQEYISYMQSTINPVEGQPGNRVQSAAESSFDAWIKGYRPNENSYNNTISYYGKGEVIATLLDLEIITNTKGQKCLEDVMKYLYQEYYKNKKRGFTNEEFIKAAELVAGKPLGDFFKKYAFGTETPDYKALFEKAGIEVIVNPTDKDKVTLGANLGESGGKLMIKSVVRGTCAYEYGLNMDDEILAVDGFRVNADKLTKYLATKKNGDKVKFLISRDDIIKEVTVTLYPRELITYTLNNKEKKTIEQTTVFNKWLYVK